MHTTKNSLFDVHILQPAFLNYVLSLEISLFSKMSASSLALSEPHHSATRNVPMTPASLWTITTAWVLLMAAILVLNLPVLYIFHATEQLSSSRSKYIASLLVSDLMLSLLIPLKIVGFHGLLASSRVACHGVLYLEQAFITVNVYMILSLSLVRNKYISYGFGFRQTPTETNVFLFLVWIIGFLLSFRVHLLLGERPSHLRDVSDGLLCMSSVGNVPRVDFHEFLVDYAIPTSAVFYFSQNSRHLLLRQRLKEVSLAVRNKLDSRGVRMTMVQMACVALLHLPKHVLVIFSYYHSLNTELLFLLDEWFQFLVYAIGVSNVTVYMFFNRKSVPAFMSFMKNRRPSPTFREDDSTDPSKSDRGTSQFMLALRRTYSTFTMRANSMEMRKLPSPRSTRSSSGSMRILYSTRMGGPSEEPQPAVSKSGTNQRPAAHQVRSPPGLSGHEDKKT